MALQFAVSTRNARANAVETDIGASPTLEIRTGAPPADCAAADTGSLLATLSLPADFMADAANGSKAKNGTWAGTASGTGQAGHFRLKASGGACKVQGTVGQGSGDLSVDNVNFATGQAFSISAFTINEPNG